PLLLGLSLFSADLGNQLLDVIVRWLDDWQTGALAFGGLVLLTAVLGVTGRFSLRDYDGTSTDQSTLSGTTALALGIVGVVGIVLGIVIADRRWLFLPAGVALVLFAVLSGPTRVREANPES